MAESGVGIGETTLIKDGASEPEQHPGNKKKRATTKKTKALRYDSRERNPVMRPR